MNQDADNWDVLQSLFHLAAEHPEADLDALLLHACADAELRTRAKVLILLARESAADSGAGAAASANGTEPVQRRIGPYTIVRLLGSGGIGTVYLTERITGGVVQRAAVKVLSQHAAGPSFAERFAREQHILASLDHPNITRMLDAGLSSAGEPYLVMEYVDGIHLDTYCDDRSLDLPARLKLFLQVCEAVAYAHRNLIVHLDLKPSNILVAAEEGHVKLLDFGTSKLIQSDSLLTTTVMATPAYASPEQLRNDPVTTACDVYALGAILFELLSGRRPNQDRSVAVMIERSIKELPPEPITGAITPEAATHRGVTQTRLLNLLRGDLATIVAKCLAPRPKDRYTTVDAIITDIQRYLAGRPILARPQTTTYRLTKFVRRNRKAFIAGVFAVLALAATSGYALWRQHQAVVAGQRALQMQTFLYQLFKLANANYTGKPAATVPEFLQLGVNVLPAFIQNPADQRAAQLSLAESMSADGDFAPAQDVFNRVIAEAKAAHDIPAEAEAEAYASDNADTLGKTELAYSLSAAALALAHKPGVTPSVRVLIEVFYASIRDNVKFGAEENTRLLQQAAAESRTLSDRDKTFALARLAGRLAEHGQPKDAEPLMREVVAIHTRQPYATCDLAEDYGTLAFIEGAQGDLPGSLASYQHSYDGLKTCFGADNDQSLEMQVRVAETLIRLKRAPEVIPMLETSLPAWRKITGETKALSDPLIYLTRAYLDVGNFPMAAQRAAELLEVQKNLDPNTYRIGVSQLVLAQAMAGMHHDQEALPHAQAADRVLAATGTRTDNQRHNAAQAHALLLDLQTRLNHPAPAQTPVNPPQPAKTP